MSFVYGFMIVCFCLVLMSSLFKSLDSTSTTRQEDLVRAVVMVALILLIAKVWR